jgi:signal transduction histidine kinase
VFRIFQEALTNVARHAEARKVDAALSVSDGVLMLVVHDDGKGIDPSAVEAPRSLGLIGMLERAENVGGHVVFARHSKKGTVVTLTLPLPANANLDLLHENPNY